MYRWRSRGLGAASPSAFSTLANAIFRQEGTLNKDGSWNTSSVGYQLNNPGNLVYAGQAGAVPVSRYDPVMGATQVYASWPSLDAGILGTEKQLALDAGRGLTLSQRLSTWATGNQSAYISNVSGWLGVDPNTPLSALAAPGGDGGSIPIPGVDIVPTDPAVSAAPLGDGSIPDSWGSIAFSGDSGLSGAAWAGLGLAAAGLLALALVN